MMLLFVEKEINYGSIDCVVYKNDAVNYWIQFFNTWNTLSFHYQILISYLCLWSYPNYCLKIKTT